MLFFLSVAGIFLSILLLSFNWKKFRSTVYLGSYFFVLSIYISMQYILLDSKSVFLLAVFPGLAFLTYLIGPFLYWYVRSVLNDDAILKKQDIWHLVPAVVYFLSMLPYLFTSYSYKAGIAKEIIRNVDFLGHFRYTFLSDLFTVQGMYLSRPALVLLYTLWSAGLFIRYYLKRDDKEVLTHQRFMHTWLIVLLGFQLVLTVSQILLMIRPLPEFTAISLLQILSAAGLTGLLISPFFFPEVLYGLPRLAGHVDNPSLPGEDGSQVNGKDKKQNPGFESDYMASIEQKIQSCMEEHQPYLKPDCNIASVSKLVKIPVHHLAYYFRDVRRQSFNDFRNEWRVNHAKKMISDGKGKDLTLEAIGLLSGFSSRITFFNAFRKMEGVSPGVFAAKYPL